MTYVKAVFAADKIRYTYRYRVLYNLPLLPLSEQHGLLFLFPSCSWSVDIPVSTISALPIKDLTFGNNLWQAGSVKKMTSVHYLTLLLALLREAIWLAPFHVQVPTIGKVKNPPKESCGLTDGSREMFRGFSHPGEDSFWKFTQYFLIVFFLNLAQNPICNILKIKNRSAEPILTDLLWMHLCVCERRGLWGYLPVPNRLSPDTFCTPRSFSRSYSS